MQAEDLDLNKALTIARGIEISTTQMKDITEQSKAVLGMFKNKRGKKQNKNARHAERYVLNVKSLIIIQECVGVKSCII